MLIFFSSPSACFITWIIAVAQHAFFHDLNMMDGERQLGDKRGTANGEMQGQCFILKWEWLTPLALQTNLWRDHCVIIGQAGAHSVPSLALYCSVSLAHSPNYVAHSNLSVNFGKRQDN